MNKAAKILALLGLAASMPSGVESTERPPWRGKPSRMRRRARRENPNARGFASGMAFEKFFDHDTRDARWKQLREKGSRHVVRYSETLSGRCVWFVAWAR